MDAFNFAFSLFAIVLGLSLVEVLTGFARALKRRRVVHLGWLTPLAAIFVMLDLTSFWEFGWGSRRFVSPQYGYLLIGLFVSGLYYLAASLIFPSEFGEGREEGQGAYFDAHYMQHRAQVFGAVTLCDLIEVTPVLIIRFHEIPARVWIENVLQFSALATCIVSRSKRATIAALAILIGIYVYTAVMSFVSPVPL
jgi:hypothetical protein